MSIVPDEVEFDEHSTTQEQAQTHSTHNADTYQTGNNNNEEKIDYDYDNENNEDKPFNDINKNTTRFRSVRVIKKTQGCGVLFTKISNKLQDIFQKCGFCKENDTNQSQYIEPPKRHIYYGPMYDNIIENKYYTKEPHLDNEDTSSFVPNYISTTKYTILSFLPLNLFEQFRRVANLYFLVIAILSSTTLSPKNPLFSIFPLSVVLLVSAIKEIYEDYKRYLMDKEINGRKCLVYRPDEYGKNWKFREIEWQDIEIGDILKITKDNRAFPCDMLLLQSSTNQGLCNIETSNLDGETNLKIKQAVSATYLINTDNNGNKYPGNEMLQFELASESPNEEIDRWKGVLYMKGNKNDPVSVGINQFLLRGCTLRNTDWIISVVVFTGVESKLALNNKEAPFKRSHVDLVVDVALYIIFFFQFCLCLFGAISHYIYLNNNANHQWYQYITSTGGFETNFKTQAALNYFTFLVLLDVFVPISLYVSMELVKFTQAILIDSDNSMTYTDPDDDSGKPVKLNAKARTSNLNEELGQVSFIFSDKTGTLTQNKMEFLKCHVGNIRYGPGEMEKQNNYVDRVVTPNNMPAFDQRKCRFTDNRLAKNRNDPIINEFLTLMSVCHSIIPEYPDGPGGKIVYNASSPDEKALVILAKNLHYYFYDGHVQVMNFRSKQIDGHRFYVNIFGEQHEFNIYHMLEFTSKRKRMSIIVKDPRDNKFKLYCKGADNVIYQRLNKKYQENEWENTLESLKYFAAEGLRTLVCGYKILDDNEYYEWLIKLNKAASSFENRDNLIEELYDEIENNLILLGATAIEDKLQDGVPETIANLAIAGISLWVLTGDKVETAINIGRSAKLLKSSMNVDDKSLIVLDPPEKMPKDECKQFVIRQFEECWEYLKNKPENNSEQGFVISGKALSIVFPARKHDKKGKEIPPSLDEQKEEEKFQNELLRICKKCRAVICCRVSPIQKAQVVKLVKYNVKNTITLAIGDGANDVPMIKAAHVGIGISGQEGLQAVMASDYAISQFKYLKELLLVHGAWDYRRIAVIILYSFYKNICFSMTQVWFSIFSGFSGTLFYDGLSGSCFNLIYTAFPVLFAAVLDRPYSKEIARVCPELYENGPNNGSFSIKIFIRYVIEGVIDSIIIFFCNIFFIDNVIYPNGKNVGFWVAATTQFTSMVFVVNFKILLETRTWTSYTLLIWFLSILSWFLFTLIWSSLPFGLTTQNYDMWKVSQMSMQLPQFWFCVLLTTGVSIIPSILFKYLKKMYFPTRFDMIEELELDKNKREKFLNDVNQHISNTETKDKEKPFELKRKPSSAQHLGFSEFAVGSDHPGYVLSQKKIFSIVMKKPRFLSNLIKIKKKKKKNKKSIEKNNNDNNNSDDINELTEEKTNVNNNNNKIKISGIQEENDE